jgi:hypothetical protein
MAILHGDDMTRKSFAKLDAEIASALRRKPERLMTYYHGTSRANWHPHIGACLVESETIARQFPIGSNNRRLFEVTVDVSNLAIDDRTSEVDRDENDYPGDTKASLAHLAADGLDAVTYRDETERGRTFQCFRLVTPAAVSAVRSVEEIEKVDDD